MFDWNDEEITNIMWGEGQESDHTVPYPDGREEKPSGLYGDETRKEWNEGAEDIKLVKQRSPVSRSDLNGAKQESSSQYDKNGSRPAKGLKEESWPDISLSNIPKPNQDSMGTEAPKNKAEISRPGSSMQAGETAQLSDCSEIFSNEDKEQGNFVDYDWASIGSFDDLDRIFSNDGPISGHASLINEDELWPSFKDETRSPEKCMPLSFEFPSISLGAPRSTSNQLETTSEYIFRQDRPSASGGYTNKNTSRTTQDQQVCMDTTRYTGGEVKPLPMEKGKRQKEVKSEEKMEVREQQEICSSWSTSGNQFQQFDSYAPSIRQFCPPLLTHQLNFCEGNNKTVTFVNEVSPSSSYPQNKISDAAMRTPPMTPQEKIEKLRRRQQMRAMLAIHKQQQQFKNPVSASEHPVVELANKQVENLNILSTIDPNSPVEQDDANCISNDAAEHSVLNRFQTIIGKMDIRMRLCIRDSLFRLAQSTIQRKCASDTSSGNRGSMDEVFNKDCSYSQNRLSRMAGAETETNPIDRTVAHLLFHMPLLSPGTNCERPATPSSSNLHNSRKAAGSVSLAGTFIPPENNQTPSHDESTVSFLFLDGDQSKGSLCVDSSENASNDEAADGAVAGFQAPH